MSAKKKSHLRVIKGGNNPSKNSKLAVNKPLIGIVQSTELDPKKGLRAGDYLDPAQMRAKVSEEHQKGRSRIYPEINVLNAAKGWYRSMIREARRDGYTDMKKFFKESIFVGPNDKKLFDAVKALIEFEQSLPRKKEG